MSDAQRQRTPGTNGALHEADSSSAKAMADGEHQATFEDGEGGADCLSRDAEDLAQVALRREQIACLEHADMHHARELVGDERAHRVGRHVVSMKRFLRRLRTPRGSLRLRGWREPCGCQVAVRGPSIPSNVGHARVPWSVSLVNARNVW